MIVKNNGLRYLVIASHVLASVFACVIGECHLA